MCFLVNARDFKLPTVAFLQVEHAQDQVLEKLRFRIAYGTFFNGRACARPGYARPGTRKIDQRRFANCFVLFAVINLVNKNSTYNCYIL